MYIARAVHACELLVSAHMQCTTIVLQCVRIKMVYLYHHYEISVLKYKVMKFYQSVIK